MNLSTCIFIKWHSEGSLLDGIIKIPQLIAFCKANDMPAVAVTDHGVVTKAIQLYTKAKEMEVKSIIGAELYLSPTDDHTLREEVDGIRYYHITLLAKNARGVSELYKLSSIGYLEGMYYKPRVSLKLIEEIGKNLIVMGACIQGPVTRNVLRSIKGEDTLQRAKSYLGRLKDSFGEDFYIEIMDNGYEEQKQINPILESLCKEFDVKWVPTNDAHFLLKEDHLVHSVMMAIQQKKTLQEVKDSGGMIYSSECYVKSGEEMSSLFTKEACKRTLEVAEKVNIELVLNKTLFPNFER